MSGAGQWNVEVDVLKRVVVASAFLIISAVPAEMLGCGDKFLVPGRGMRSYARTVDRESAAILLYASPGSALSAKLTGLSVEATLRKAGYRPTSVASAAAFERALRTGGWDVLIIDLADGPYIAGQIAAGAAPIVLPVAYEAQKDSLDAAKTQYQQILNSPRKDHAFLEAIDKAIAARTKARAKAAARKGT